MPPDASHGDPAQRTITHFSAQRSMHNKPAHIARDYKPTLVIQLSIPGRLLAIFLNTARLNPENHRSLRRATPLSPSFRQTPESPATVNIKLSALNSPTQDPTRIDQLAAKNNLAMKQTRALKRSIEVIDLTSPEPEPSGRVFKMSKIATPMGPRSKTTKTVHLPTPPSTASSGRSISNPRETVKLSLVIPQPPSPDAKERRRIAARKAADTRTKHKLQLSFPDQKEIKNARPLKLLRHYAGDKNNHSVSTPIIPKIKKSERVTNLLKQFPKLETSVTIPAADEVGTPLDLQRNRAITNSDDAQRLAWSKFSNPHFLLQGMAESGLLSEDLQKEAERVENDLPEWRKRNTSHYRAENMRSDDKHAKNREAKMKTNNRLEQNLKLLREEQQKIKQIEKQLEGFGKVNTSSYRSK